MDNAVLVDPELHSTALGIFYSLFDIWRDSSDFRVRHEPFGAELFTEASDKRHHVRRCDDTVKIHLTVLDFFNQILSTDNISTRRFGFFRFIVLGKDSDPNAPTCSVRQADNTTHHLICVSWVNTQIHGDFDSLVKFCRGIGFDLTNSICDRAQLKKIKTIFQITNSFSDFRRHLISPPLSGPWPVQTRR